MIGGGIVGLSGAMALGQQRPTAKILVLEKENRLAPHQTSHNSGVIHSGIYYKPGSLKAKFCREGNRSLVEFCQQHQVNYEICGKVIVATRPEELPLLHQLYQRGLDNQIPVEQISASAVQEIEPHVQCLAGLKVSSTGIVNYHQVCQKYAELIQTQGSEIRFQSRVEKIQQTPSGLVLETSQGEISTRFMINCAGLQSDRLARLSSVKPPAQIVPFRGEYYELIPEKRHLVKTLIYPVPNPNFPFLGVHFTRMIDGSIHAGPNAVLSLKREGYKKTDFNLKDTLETLTYPGFWRLAFKYAEDGIAEIIRSLSKSAFVQSLQQLIPEIQGSDLVPTAAGVRAQALKRDGQLVEDFLLVEQPRILHVCNAPSPAATASLEIGREIARKIDQLEV